MASKYQADYSKQVKRIKSWIRRAEKRGYDVDREKIDKILQRPKRVTGGSVRKLEKLTPDKLYGYATYTDPFTGEILTSAQGRRHEREIAAQKARATRQGKRREAEEFMEMADVVVDAFRLRWDTYPVKAKGAQVMMRLVDQLVGQYGKTATARAIQAWEEDFAVSFIDIAYNATSAQVAAEQIMGEMHQMLGTDAGQTIQDQYDLADLQDGDLGEDMHWVDGVEV